MSDNSFNPLTLWLLCHAVIYQLSCNFGICNSLCVMKYLATIYNSVIRRPGNKRS